MLQPSYPHLHALSYGLRGLVLSQKPRRLGPRSRRLLLCPPHTHTERPRCLASAATALLFLLPPRMQILQNVHPSPPFVEGPGGGLPAV